MHCYWIHDRKREKLRRTQRAWRTFRESFDPDLSLKCFVTAIHSSTNRESNNRSIGVRRLVHGIWRPSCSKLRWLDRMMPGINHETADECNPTGPIVNLTEELGFARLESCWQGIRRFYLNDSGFWMERWITESIRGYRFHGLTTIRISWIEVCLLNGISLGTVDSDRISHNYIF